MVILGGLEIVAAGYILNEIKKDDKRSKSEERRRRKRHEQRHDSHSSSRPSGPTTQGGQLIPPGYAHRPNSAPPPKMRPQYPAQHPPMPMLGHGPMQTQTWPAQARPPTKAEVGQWYNQRPPQAQRPQQRPQPPMPVPGMIQHNPTMHFDTKTGQWQSNMLPVEMQPANSAGAAGKRSLSNVGLGEARAVSVDNLPLVLRKGSASSVSSVSTSTGSDDEGLAYGKSHGAQNLKVRSRERRRPSELSAASVPRVAQPVELDWYATQKQPNSISTGGRGGTPAMAQAMLNRDGRANTMPPMQQNGYSMSSPNLGVFEMDGTGVKRGSKQRPVQQGQGQSQQGQSPRVQPVELDGRETQRYRAYRP
jgi:hypothetical protein